MRHLSARLVVFLALAAPAWVGAQQAVVDVRAPHTAVIREFGWAANTTTANDVSQIEVGTSAEFALLSAREVLQRQHAGKPGKVVFVLSRADSDFQVLVASERLLSSEPSRIQAVVDLFEKSRRWLLGNPEAAARMLGAANGTAQETARSAQAGRDYRVARPGPALLQALKTETANPTSDLVALLDDSFVRVAARRMERPAEGTLVSSR